MADKERKRRKRKLSEADEVELRKHYETFYEQAPPGIIQEGREKPEDCIPDLPENQGARDFLAHAPTKGLWMPLGKEVKVMKCWRCKQYGHRTGDRECPMFVSGNKQSEKFRMANEDPMHEFIQANKKAESDNRIAQLQALLDESTTSHSSSDGSDDSEQKSKTRRHKKRKSKESKRKNRSHAHKHKHRSSKKRSSTADGRPRHKKTQR